VLSQLSYPPTFSDPMDCTEAAFANNFNPQCQD
jgi:hypothetical protein